MLVAAVALWIWVSMRSHSRADWAHWPCVLVATVFFSLLLAFTHVGFSHTSAARGIVLLNSTPLFVALFATFLGPREPMTFVKASGIALAFGGVVTIFFHRLDYSGASVLGDGL